MGGLSKRSVRETVVKAVEAAMTETGWSVVGEVPFGAAPVTVTTKEPTPGQAIAGNLVHVFFGPTSERVPDELGAGVVPGALSKVSWAVFIDVFAEKSSLAMDIGDDLVNWLEANSVFPVLNARVPGNPPIPDQYVDVAAILGPDVPEESKDATDFRRHWQVVSVELDVYYSILSAVA